MNEQRTPRHLDMKTSLELVRQYAWLEKSLFEIVGGWVTSIEEPRARVQLETSSRHHVLHAELWEGLIVGLGGSADDEVRPECADDLAPLLQDLRSPDHGGPLEKMVGYYRVLLPRLASAYTIHLQRSDRAAGEPASRILKIVLREEVAEWRSGEILLQAYLDDEDAIMRAAQRQGALETIAHSCRFSPGTDLVWGSSGARPGLGPQHTVDVTWRLDSGGTL